MKLKLSFSFVFTFLAKNIILSIATNIAQSSGFNKNKIITCESTIPTVPNDCNSISDNYISCCFLNSTVPTTSWQRMSCIPIRPQTTPYPFFKVIFGVGFTMKCNDHLTKLQDDIHPVTAERYTPCGPVKPKNVHDCLPYSLKYNTCCMGTYFVDALSIKVNQCFYYGSTYSQEDRNLLSLNNTIKIGKTKLFCAEKFFIQLEIFSIVLLLNFILN